MQNFVPLVDMVDELKNVRERRWGRYTDLAVKLLATVGYEIQVRKREKKLSSRMLFDLPSFRSYFNHERLRYMDIQVSKFYVNGEKKQASFISRIASDADSGCFTSLAHFLKASSHLVEWQIVDTTQFHPNRWTFGTGMYWFHMGGDYKAERFTELHESHSTASYGWPVIPVVDHLFRTGHKLVINGKEAPAAGLRVLMMKLAENAGSLPSKSSGYHEVIGRWFYSDRYKYGPPFQKVIDLFNFYHCDIRIVDSKNRLVIDLTKPTGLKSKRRPVLRKVASY